MSKARQAVQRLTARCTLCGTQQPLNASLINTNASEIELLHIKCTICKGALVAAVFTKDHTITSVGMITDLNEQEVEQWQQNEALSNEDVNKLSATIRDKRLCEYLLKSY